MSKRIFTSLLVLLLVLCAGCGNAAERLSTDRGDEPSPVSKSEPDSPAVTLSVNPLTGKADLSPDKAGTRPVAVMVNNIAIAQSVQTGISRADIIYETEVEGGITRLMAVYQDISRVEKIGSIRSARYAYVDLAMGHNAVYLHHGQDPTYCKPHLKDVVDMDAADSRFSSRIRNGLASEHTLYVEGAKLWSAISGSTAKTKTANKSWQNFAAEGSPVTLPNPANSVSVGFSSSYKTVFQYQSESGTYQRSFNTTVNKDYFTGDTTRVKNVFVLLTTIRNYADGKHREIKLDSGTGYYFVNGTYTEIRWKKGAAANAFVFTNTDGTPLTVNAGNSWVCIANQATSRPVIR